MRHTGSVVDARDAAALRPVSRVSFSLTDKNAFDEAIRFSVDWLSGKCGGRLPDEARAFDSFDTRGTDDCHPCHAVRIDDSAGSVWAARIDEPGSRPELGETWSTEIFVEKTPRDLVRFGTQLTVRRRAEAGPLRSSRPRLVYDLLRTLSAEADGEAMTESVTEVTLRDVDTLTDLIYRPARRLPIIAVSVDGQGLLPLDLKPLAIRLSGAAHLVALDAAASWELTRQLGKRMSTFNGALRVYMPGVVEDEEDPFAHPLWLPQSSVRNPRLLDGLADRVFPLGFQDMEGGSRFWHSARLRHAASAATAARGSGTELDRLKADISALEDRIADLTETLETAKGLERIAADNERAAQHRVEQLKTENGSLKATLYRFEHAVSTVPEAPAPASRPLDGYDDLEDWADEVLGPSIVIHRKALKDCRQNGHPAMLERIRDTLLAIRDHWVPHRLNGGLALREATAAALGALGVEDEPCFGRRDKAKERLEYSVPDGKVTRVLYDHFKYGNSRSNAEQFRIYYSWDDDERRLHIGKMPSHLGNDLS